jgi:hypothetical protein
MNEKKTTCADMHVHSSASQLSKLGVQRSLALTGWPLLGERLARGGLVAVRERSWEASMDRLAAGYRQALTVAETRRAREIA